MARVRVISVVFEDFMVEVCKMCLEGPNCGES